MDIKDEIGVITALLERFEKFRLPRAQRLHERVMQGEKLTESDMAFLEDVFATAEDVKPLLRKYPQYQDMALKAASLYTEIMDKALENEKQGS